jgi:methyl-accepting chemotaxis protein
MFEKEPRTFSPEFKKLSPEQKAMVKLEITLSRFFKTFDRSISRWERMIYPMLLVLGILGLSGFYLIYNITKDMNTMSHNMDPDMQTNLASMSQNMADLSKNIAIMTKQVGKMTGNIDSMSQNIAVMNKNIYSMDKHIGNMDVNMSGIKQDLVQMNNTMRLMNVNTGLMSQDMSGLNQHIGRPARFISNFAPW